MNTFKSESRENKNQAATSWGPSCKGRPSPALQFFDKRPEAIRQRKLQEGISRASQGRQVPALNEVTPVYRNVVQTAPETLDDYLYDNNFYLRTSDQDVNTEDKTFKKLLKPIQTLVKDNFKPGVSMDKKAALLATPLSKLLPNPNDYHFGVNKNHDDKGEKIRNPFLRLDHRWRAIKKVGGKVAEFHFKPEDYSSKLGEGYHEGLFRDEEQPAFVKKWNADREKAKPTVDDQSGSTIEEWGARFSKGTLTYTLFKGGTVRFHLDNMKNKDFILNKPKKKIEAPTNPAYDKWVEKNKEMKYADDNKNKIDYGNAVTSKELRFIQRYWKKPIPDMPENSVYKQFDDNNVVFYRNGKEVDNPIKLREQQKEQERRERELIEEAKAKQALERQEKTKEPKSKGMTEKRTGRSMLGIISQGSDDATASTELSTDTGNPSDGTLQDLYMDTSHSGRVIPDTGGPSDDHTDHPFGGLNPSSEFSPNTHTNSAPSPEEQNPKTGGLLPAVVQPGTVGNPGRTRPAWLEKITHPQKSWLPNVRNPFSK